MRWSAFVLLLWLQVASAAPCPQQEDQGPSALPGREPPDWCSASLLERSRPGPPGPGPQQRPAATATLHGRVFERGGLAPLPRAVIRPVPSGAPVIADEQGRFTLHLPPGPVTLHIRLPDYEALLVRETLAQGQVLSREYRLLLLPGRYVARVRAEGQQRGERFSLEGEGLRNLPGSLGDPFRSVGTLPGVATPLPLLPIYVVRGASPGMNGYFLDGMRVPQLFHLLLLGGVVHPRMIERLDFYPGAYDASFGHFAGGIIDAETRAAGDGFHAEAELRLIDASAAAELTLPGDVRVAVSGHYGYPGPLLQAINPQVNLSYWDYQLRVDWKALTLQVLGSYDAVNIADQLLTGSVLPGTGVSQAPDQFLLTFHRIQLRGRHKLGRLELEAALVGGYDQMNFWGNGVQKLSLAARAVARLRWRRLLLAAGVEGELSQFTPQLQVSPMASGLAPDELGELGQSRNGIVGGAYVNGTAELIPDALTLVAGVRTDAYHAGLVTLLGVDPRFQLRLQPLPQLRLTVGGGWYHQPPGFPVPLPGIDTYALQLGLQESLQGEVGQELWLPGTFTLSAKGFYSRLRNASDVVLDFQPLACTAPVSPSLSGLPAEATRQVDGAAYGMELLLRRHTGRLRGWVAYTLSRSDRLYTCGLRPSDYDQTHILNVVLQAVLPWRLLAGARFFYSTGRPVTRLDQGNTNGQVRNNARLPDTFELDLRIDREWIFQRFRLTGFLEVVNATFSQVVFGVTCPMLPNGMLNCMNPQLNGFNWILPSIGVRAQF